MNSVREAHFIDNFADRHGGVMWADDDSTAVTYNQFLLHSTDFIDPSRQCFVIFGNEGLANVDGSTDVGARIMQSSALISTQDFFDCSNQSLLACLTSWVVVVLHVNLPSLVGLRQV